MRRPIRPGEQSSSMIGLAGAGKRTALAGIRGPLTTSAQSSPLTLSTVEFKKSRWLAGDIGDPREAPLWRAFYPDTTGLIVVVDSADHARIEDARSELHRVIAERDLPDVPLLVMATKLNPVEIEDRLALHRIRDRPWSVQPTCATRLDGLYDGVVWLADAVA